MGHGSVGVLYWVQKEGRRSMSDLRLAGFRLEMQGVYIEGTRVQCVAFYTVTLAANVNATSLSLNRSGDHVQQRGCRKFILCSRAIHIL
jgi:hypothetical protein